MPEAVSEEMWNDWKQHPVTKALQNWASEQRLALMEDWATSQFLGEGQFGTAMVNAKAVAQCELLAELMDLDYQRVFGGEDGQSGAV